jgi:integrase
MMDYGFKVVYATSQFLLEAGFGKVAHLPFIFDSEPGYARFPNQFLIDRGLGFWDPTGRGARRNPSPPSRVSMRDYAYWLANALEWAKTRKLDLMTSDYVNDLILGYQKEMLNGAWSTSGKPLGESTVNGRVGIALEFQMWAADKGLRDPFEVPRITKSYYSGSFANSKSHNVKSVEARKGKVKQRARALLLPSIEEVNTWRRCVYETPISGKTDGLIADLILNTAIRREEASCWRIDTLPLDPSEWEIANPRQPEEFQNVLVTIKYGTKGKEYGIDKYGDKLGPQGTIHLPLWLARALHNYRENERLIALKPLLKQGRSAESQRRTLNDTVHLFLNPATGKRYTGYQIYSFWKQANGPRDWSPHMGRHWWACTYLHEQIMKQTELMQQVLRSQNQGRDHPVVLALREFVQTIIQLHIQPQLRHTSTNSTEIYLEWLFNELRVTLSVTQSWIELDETN